MASNRSFNIFESKERSTDTASNKLSNLNNAAAHFVVDLTAINTGYISLEVYGISASGAEYRIFRTLPMTHVATYRYIISPTQNCVPGIVCRDFLPANIRYKMVHSGGAVATYTADLELGEG